MEKVTLPVFSNSNMCLQPVNEQFVNTRSPRDQPFVDVTKGAHTSPIPLAG